MKRKNISSKTDVNPQWFNTGQSAIAAGYAEVETRIPIQRLTTGGRSQVMEVLKVEYGLPSNTTLNVTAGTDSSSRVYLLTSSFGTTEPTAASSSGRVISRWNFQLPSEGTGLSSFGVHTPYTADLTDGAGNGVLVATDSVFVATNQTAATSPINGTVNVRILYRWKNVGLTEYIGIVQSQT